MAFRFIDEDQSQPQQISNNVSTVPRRSFRYVDGPPPTPPPVQPQSNDDANVFERALDLGIDLGKGAVNLGGSVVGLVDMPTGGLVGRGMRAMGYDPEGTNERLSSLYSPERQQEEAQFEAAQGVGGKLGALVSEPATLVGRVAESVPQMLGSAGIARAVYANVLAKTGSVAAATRAATLAASASEGAQQAGSSFQRMTGDGIAPEDAYVPSIGSGLTTAAIGYGAGRLGSKIGLGDVEAGIAASGGWPTRIAKSAVQEGLLEEMPQSATEQAWSNLGYDRPIMQGVPEAGAVGGLVGAAAGGGFGMMGGRQSQVGQPDELLQDNQDAQTSNQQQPEAAPIDVPGSVLRQRGELEEVPLDAGTDAPQYDSTLTPYQHVPGSQKDLLRNIHRQRVSQDYDIAEAQRDQLLHDEGFRLADQQRREEQDAVLAYRIRQDKAADDAGPTALQLAMERARSTTMPQQEQYPASTYILPKSGKPFSTERSALLWLKNNPEHSGANPVNVGVKQWVLRRPPVVQPQAPMQPAQAPEPTPMQQPKKGQLATLPENRVDISAPEPQILSSEKQVAEQVSKPQGPAQAGSLNRTVTMRDLVDAGAVKRLGETPEGKQSLTIETLEDVGLLRKNNRGKWQYKSSINGGWMTARNEQDAIEIASMAYQRTPENERLTREQRNKKAGYEWRKMMDERYGRLSRKEIDSKIQSIGIDVERHYKSAKRELNGGGRRTGPAVSAEAARTFAEEKRWLERYRNEKFQTETEPSTVKQDSTIETPKADIAPQVSSPTDPVITAALAYAKGSKDKYQSYLRGRFPKSKRDAMASEVEQAWANREKSLTEKVNEAIGKKPEAAPDNARALRDKSAELMRKAEDLTKQAEEIEKSRTKVEPERQVAPTDYSKAKSELFGKNETAPKPAQPEPKQEAISDGREPTANEKLTTQELAAERKRDIVEHTTQKGKVLRGVVRSDLSKAQAQAIDPYTFKKDGGWFIREKHLGGAAPEVEEDASEAPRFSKRVLTPEDDFVSTAVTLLAESEDIFQNPTSDKKAFGEIAKDINPAMRVTDSTNLLPIHANGGKDGKAWSIKMPDGSAATIKENRNEVWIDASRLESTKSGGTLLYHLVGTYAHNNGKVFIGDPDGLSDAALRRRTENMLSLALKFGTTDFMLPHQKQIEGDAKIGVKPFKWKVGDTAFNLRQLVKASYDNTVFVHPELEDIVYDFDAREFKNSRTGKPVGRGDFENITSTPGVVRRRMPTGSATAKRAAIFNTISREASSGRGGRLLAAIGRELQGGISDALKGTFYSKQEAGRSPGLSVSEATSRLSNLLGSSTAQALLDSGKIVLVEDESKFPGGGKSIGGEHHLGVTIGGKMHINLAALDANSFDGVALHEGLHTVLKDTIGEADFDRLMRRMENLRNLSKNGTGEVGKFFKQAMDAIPADTKAEHLAEELAGYAVEKFTNAPRSLPQTIAKWVKDFLAAIKVGLMRALPQGSKLRGKLLDSASEADLARLAIVGLKRAAEGESAAAGDVAMASKRPFDGPEESKTPLGDATDNKGTFDPANPDIHYSKRKAVEGETERDRRSLGELTPRQQQALRNTGGFVERRTFKKWVGEAKKNLGKRITQGVVDQFAPLKELDMDAYIKARLSKGSDGALEALLMFGNLGLIDGVTDAKASGIGLIKTLQKLQGEQERFMWWIAANRAESLKAQGRENLFTDEDISSLKTLNQGKMPDGTSRQSAYEDAFVEFKRISKNVVDIAEQSDLIDGESRKVWEQDFYVPFYRVMEDGTAGPTVKSGLVKQYAFKKLKGGTEKLHADLLANVLRNWSHLISASAKNRAAKAALEAAAKVGAATEIQAEEKGAVHFLEKGQKRHFNVDDPYLLDAVTALEWTGFGGPSMKALTKFKHYLTVGVTANPAFKIRNLLRDTVSAMAQSQLSYNPAKNIAQGAKAVAGKKTQTYASMLASGGLIRFGAMLDGNNAERVHKLINAGVAKNTIIDTKEKIADTMQRVWDYYNELGDISENANRAALYEQLISKGMNKAEAAYAARDLLDFSMGGTFGAVRFLTQVVPFMNARLQGLYKLGRAAKADKKRFAAVTGAVALASIALLLAYRDDDDWKKREDWDRDNYWWFKIGDTAYRIPKPFEVGAIGTLAERSVELMLDDEMTGKRFGERLKRMLADTFAMNPVPQMFKPLIDVYANKDSFTGRQIETLGMERLMKSDRVSANSSEVARFLGLAGNYTNLSPVQIDFLIRAYFGWLGTMAATSSSYGLRPFMDRPANPEMKLRDVFLVGNFVETLPTSQSRYLTQFYEQAKEIEEAYATYMRKIKEGDKAGAAELFMAEKEKIQKHGIASKIKLAITRLNERQRMIENSRTLSPAEKRKMLDHLASQKDKYARMATSDIQ